MPRKSRIDAPGALHHIIGRGIDRQKIFSDDADRINFLKRLGDILTETTTACYAWALIPNHFHLLLRTGLTPISTIMRRLLTGYAVSYNHRHRRYGHLFQNRYKSILCQEDKYLLELVRYIHLNPLRSKLVKNYPSLGKYTYCGHSVVLGNGQNSWQDIGYILRLFHDKQHLARRRYKEFVQKGIARGKRAELVGGGLLRSQGGWTAVKLLRNVGSYRKGDERILGDSIFVEQVLSQANEQMERKYLIAAEGFNLEQIAGRVAELLDMSAEEVLDSVRSKRSVQARGLLCYWATRELGIRQSQLAQKFNLTQPAISQAVRRGEQLVRLNQYKLFEK
ncbi:MAG: transposase [Planctomycetota bacterium]|jgi:REP element-mobilizing transposase RayT